MAQLYTAEALSRTATPSQIQVCGSACAWSVPLQVLAQAIASAPSFSTQLLSLHNKFPGATSIPFSTSTNTTTTTTTQVITYGACCACARASVAQALRKSCCSRPCAPSCPVQGRLLYSPVLLLLASFTCLIHESPRKHPHVSPRVPCTCLTKCLGAWHAHA